MNKKGVMFTLAAVFLVLVILAAFLVQTNNKTKTDIQVSSIRTKTTNSFLNSLNNYYLPNALEITMENTGASNPDESYLNQLISEDITLLAIKSGIEFSFTSVETITSTENPLELGFYDASFDITFTITNKNTTYKDITETISITGFEA